MTLTALWVSALLGFPLLVALVCSLDSKDDRVRSIAIVCASMSCALGYLAYFAPEFVSLHVPWPWQDLRVFGASMLRVTSLSQPLIGLPAALWLITIAATPSARLDIGGLRRTALATSFVTLAFLTDSPVLLAGCWIISSVLFLRGLKSAEGLRTKRFIRAYHLLSSVLLIGGIAQVTRTEETNVQGLWLICTAVLIRKGIFPFHAWIPEALDQGRIGPTVLFSAPQFGTFVAATLVIPNATPTMLQIVAILALVTALYGAALALFQPDARRALGYLFVSQSALVLAGLDCTSSDAMTGALMLWLSSAFAFTGLARTVLALEARRGRLKLTRYHGGLEQMPLLAASFLVFGLACTGFPGTVGFIGQELLVDGAVTSFPAAGFLTILTSALTGLAILRMYFSLFCGASGGVSTLRLRTREKITFGTIAVLLIVAGIAPREIVGSRKLASRDILEHRAHMQRSVEQRTLLRDLPE